MFIICIVHIKTGVDILNISEFKKQMSLGGSKFTKRCFSKKETKNNSAQSIAGIFAAKEAIIKALSLEVGDWNKIEISKEKSGKPFARIKNYNEKIVSCDLSISHNKDYVIAQFVALIE